MNAVRRFLRRLALGCKADSDAYVAYLRRLGMRIGDGTRIYSPRCCLIDETRPWMIELGSRVQVAHGVVILTHGYDWSVLQGVYGEVLGSCGKVTIGDNVFLGANSVILKGVTIGSNVIIGAGSVVTGDIPDSCVAAGNPARVLMTLDRYYEKRKAAQPAEARVLTEEYRKVYGKDPDEQALREFYWLFSEDPQHLPRCWEEMLHDSGDYRRCAEKLRRNRKLYADMDGFLASCRRF